MDGHRKQSQAACIYHTQYESVASPGSFGDFGISPCLSCRHVGHLALKTNDLVTNDTTCHKSIAEAFIPTISANTTQMCPEVSMKKLAFPASKDSWIGAVGGLLGAVVGMLGML